jgi:hypothetical protein
VGCGCSAGCWGSPGRLCMGVWVAPLRVRVGRPWCSPHPPPQRASPGIFCFALLRRLLCQPAPSSARPVRPPRARRYLYLPHTDTVVVVTANPAPSDAAALAAAEAAAASPAHTEHSRTEGLRCAAGGAAALQLGRGMQPCSYAAAACSCEPCGRGQEASSSLGRYAGPAVEIRYLLWAASPQRWGQPGLRRCERHAPSRSPPSRAPHWRRKLLEGVTARGGQAAAPPASSASPSGQAAASTAGAPHHRPGFLHRGPCTLHAQHPTFSMDMWRPLPLPWRSQLSSPSLQAGAWRSSARRCWRRGRGRWTRSGWRPSTPRRPSTGGPWGHSGWAGAMWLGWGALAGVGNVAGGTALRGWAGGRPGGACSLVHVAIAKGAPP